MVFEYFARHLILSNGYPQRIQSVRNTALPQPLLQKLFKIPYRALGEIRAKHCFFSMFKIRLAMYGNEKHRKHKAGVAKTHLLPIKKPESVRNLHQVPRMRAFKNKRSAMSLHYSLQKRREIIQSLKEHRKHARYLLAIFPCFRVPCDGAHPL